MTKSELVRVVAANVGITQADVERVINFVVLAISGALAQEGRFELGGFGVFKKAKRAAVSRPNPQDRSKTIHTPARNTVKFRPGPKLKALVQ